MNYFPRSIDRGHAYRSLDIHTDTFLLDLELLLFTTFSSSEFQRQPFKEIPASNREEEEESVETPCGGRNCRFQLKIAPFL